MKLRWLCAFVLAGGLLSGPAIAQGVDDGTPRKRAEELRERLLQAFDRDGDGRLSEAEKGAAREAFLRRGRERFGDGPHHPAREEVLERFDANKNGRLDPDELARARQELLGQRHGPLPPRFDGVGPDWKGILERFDANANGVLDPQERQKLRAYITERRGRDCEERGLPFEGRILQRFDENGNGVLDPEERAKAIEELRRSRGAGGVGSSLPPRRIL